MSEWQPISTAPREFMVYARDSDGVEGHTRMEFGDWVRESYRTTDDGYEYLADDLWFPVEWLNPGAPPEGGEG